MDTKKNIISKDFVTEVAKYFMAFLETDFKKRSQPKRNLTSRVNKGISTGLYLDKYEPLYRELYKNFIGGFPKETIEVKLGEYTTKISDRLVSLLEQRIDQLTDEETKLVVVEISKEINQLRLDNQKDYDNYFETSLEVIKAKFANTIVTKLLNDIEQSLEAAGWSAESGLFQLETDATASIYALAEDTIASILEEFFAEAHNSYNLSDALSSVFDVDSIKSALKEFFKNFSAKDAYSEILHLNRNKDMLDKTELYVYFGEIGIDNNSFPLFYTPISVEQEDSTVAITFENRVFVNIKAIEFVIQQNNISTSSNENVAGNFERIIYFEDKKDLLPELQRVIDSCRDALGLTKPVELKQSTQQVANNMVARVSNRLQIFLFDKSDESLINDYEEIIDNQGELTETFAELIETFVTDNPDNFIEEVAQEWEEKTIQDKLFVDSPIALNEEQKKVLLALQKEDCKVAILEGPPGTGKSHTITAIVCKALLEGQSVLVLSDKEEALDVVQDKITSTLSKIRHDKDFQNPILRLGKSSSGLAKVIEGQSLERVREHMRAYRSRQSEFEDAEVLAKENAKEILETVIGVGEKISLEDIKNTLMAEVKYSDIGWVEDVNDGLIESLKAVHESVLAFKSSKVLYLLPLAESRELKNLPKIIDATDSYAKTRVGINKDVTVFVGGYKTLNIDAQNILQKQLEAICSSIEDKKLKYLAEIKYRGVAGLDAFSTIAEFSSARNEFNIIRNTANATRSFAPNIRDFTELIQQALKHDIGIEELNSSFSDFVIKLQSLKSKLFGFSGKKSSIEQLVRELKTKLPYFNLSSPEKHLTELVGFADIISFLEGKLKQQALGDKYWMSTLEQLQMSDSTSDDISQILDIFSAPIEFDFVSKYRAGQVYAMQVAIVALEDARVLQELFRTNEKILQLTALDMSGILAKPDEALKKLNVLGSDIEALSEVIKHHRTIENFILHYSDVADNLGLQSGVDGVNSTDKRFIDMDVNTLDDYLNEKRKYKNLADKFEVLATDGFSDSSESLYLLNAAKMANVLDTKIINYVDHHTSDIRTLKGMLKSKQKFPKALFGDLKQAFPCILAGIRDYATYIPLEKDLFDLVIIDEASQVSIAQALPALIRGRKILVLGDDKQFSNVKAGNASILTNSKYKSNILNSLRASMDAQAKGLSSVYTARVEDNFNIKKSILDFCRFVTNYQTMLKKHFRCYPEIIGYSNKYFYNNGLQCMKARALPISEVIKFTQVDTEGVQDQYRLTNTTEANFILEQFKSLKSKGYEGSFGVITPHREQATYINNLLNESDISDWLHEHYLKVMTFDTCQGEERDYILYSMVASPQEDKHWTIFPVSMEESLKIGKEFGTREQRLNVGFSRAKETVHFVLSKPVSEYWGEVKTALLHYENVLNTTTYELGGTDENSPMEPLVQNYFYQTEFYNKNKDSVELVPQFPLGDYLKSLDRTYSHPRYKVDFLLTFGKQKIVIEYDGFNEHFIDRNEVNETNYDCYLRASDVYRQKVLEGYGYKFLRLNKFNLGKEPVKELDGLLANVVKKKIIRQGQLIPS
jgi:very-short-patch-repair endonuclease